MEMLLWRVRRTTWIVRALVDEARAGVGLAADDELARDTSTAWTDVTGVDHLTACKALLVRALRT